MTQQYLMLHDRRAFLVDGIDHWLRVMPRPILKTLPIVHTRAFSPHVHFPPTPSLASTGFTHCPKSYDRAPIVTSPNSCALPERGERVYNDRCSKESYFHPTAFHACQLEALDTVPDLTFSSSESSDDSDGYGSPPVLPNATGLSASPIPRTQSQEQLQHALSFLPYGKPMKPGSSKGDAHNKKRGARRRGLGSFCESSLDGCLGGF